METRTYIMNETQERVMNIRSWALSQANDIVGGNSCPSRTDICMLSQLIDIVKDTHEIEHYAMKNGELIELAKAKMANMSSVDMTLSAKA